MKVFHLFRRWISRGGESSRDVLSTDLIFGKELFVVAEKDSRYIKGR